MGGWSMCVCVCVAGTVRGERGAEGRVRSTMAMAATAAASATLRRCARAPRGRRRRRAARPRAPARGTWRRRSGRGVGRRRRGGCRAEAAEEPPSWCSASRRPPRRCAAADGSLSGRSRVLRRLHRHLLFAAFEKVRATLARPTRRAGVRGAQTTRGCGRLGSRGGPASSDLDERMRAAPPPPAAARPHHARDACCALCVARSCAEKRLTRHAPRTHARTRDGSLNLTPPRARR